MTEISVICSCYNSERYLSKSIQSVLNQTYQDFELIIIDDGSTDKTFELINTLVDIDSPRIKVIKNKTNVGVFQSRTYGIVNASGKYIAIHDSDDISMQNRLEKQVKFLEQHPEISFCGSFATKIGDSDQVLGSMVYPPMDTLGALKVIKQFKLNPIIDPSVMCKKKDLIDIGGYRLDENLKYAADFDLWCRMLSRGYQMVNIPEMLIQYRFHPSSNSNAKHAEMRHATDLIWGTFCKRNFPILPPLQCRIAS